MQSKYTPMKSINAALIYTFGAFLIQGINFLTLPIFSNLMNPQEFGIYTSYENWTSIITVLIGLQTAATVTIAYVDYPNENIKSYVSSIIIVGWMSFFLVCAITYVIQDLLANIFELNVGALMIGVMQCLFLYILTMLMNEYRILNQPLKYLIFSSLNTLLTVFGGIVLVLMLPQCTYLGRIWGAFIAACITGGIALIIIYSNGKVFFHAPNIKYALVLSLPLIFHAFAGIIMGKTDQMMLLKMKDAAEMGIYSYGNKIGHIIYVLYTAINQAFIPWYYKKKIASDILLIQKVVNVYVTMFSFITVISLMILPELIIFMSPATYENAIYTSPFIIFGFYINFLYTFPVNYEFYRKKTGYIAIGTMGSAFINIILNIIFIPYLGGKGAAIATAISYILLLILHLWIVNELIKDYELKYSFFAKRILLMLALLIIYFILIQAVVLRWIIALVAGTFVTALIIFEYKRLK